jgi:hypothetical protein
VKKEKLRKREKLNKEGGGVFFLWIKLEIAMNFAESGKRLGCFLLFLGAEEGLN